MATGPFLAYEKGMTAMLDGSVDFLVDTIKMALLLTAHTVDVINDDFFNDVSVDECADGDYTAGGNALASKTVATTGNKTRFDCADVAFGPSVTIGARYAVIYKDTGVATTSQLLFIADLNTGGGDLESTNSDFTVGINANGIYEVDAG